MKLILPIGCCIALGAVGCNSAPKLATKRVKILETARSAGFNFFAAARMNPASESVELKVFVGGNISKYEALRIQCQAFLESPGRPPIPVTEKYETFSPDWIRTIKVSDMPIGFGIPGSKIRFEGVAKVFTRLENKVEREMLTDGSCRLYLNTGSVLFRHIPYSKPSQIEVVTANLKSVHEHGMELLTPDKKSVAARIMLTPGRQVIERETIPYASKIMRPLEPINVGQLVPKRGEPFRVSVPITVLDDTKQKTRNEIKADQL